jgi:hypothetical protein
MAYRRYRGSRSYRARNYGMEAALRHIEEARSFSREVGGTDEDVKGYFFALSGRALDEMFSAYGRTYGSQKEAYARNTYEKWKRGSTEMGGVTAKRLFDLLPPRMPFAKKLELAGNLWRHYGPSSKHSFTVGPAADTASVMRAIQAKVHAAVQNYVIPEQLRNRFDWLSGGDVNVKEQLLNHFREAERDIALTSLGDRIPVLQRQMREAPGQTISLRTDLTVHRHAVEVWVDERLGDTFREGVPASRAGTSSGMGWIIALAIALIILLAMIAGHR